MSLFEEVKRSEPSGMQAQRKDEVSTVGHIWAQGSFAFCVLPPWPFYSALAPSSAKWK